MKIRGVHISAVFATFLITSTIRGQTFEPGHFYFDDFEDGQLRDNMPVVWGRGAWSGATERIVDGNLEINGTRDLGNINDGISILAPRNAANTSYLSYTDSTLRMRGRITEVGDGGTRIGFLARSTAPSGYFARIDDGGQADLFEFPVGGPANFLGRVQTGIDPVNNDVIMQLITAGDGLSFSVWEAGDPIPSKPLITATRPTFPTGTFGVFVQSPGSTTGSGVFRWASVSAIPEPGAIGLILCGAAVILLRRRIVERN